MTLSVTVKALCIGRSIVSAAKVAQAKEAPLSSAAAANSSTDLAWRMDGRVSREGEARKSARKAREKHLRSMDHKYHLEGAARAGSIFKKSQNCFVGSTYSELCAETVLCLVFGLPGSCKKHSKIVL